MMNKLPRKPESTIVSFPESHLKSGGGGGIDDPMEQRVTNLEGKMDKVVDRLTSIEITLAEIKGKVSMLPGYPGIALIMTMVGGALLIVERLISLAGPTLP